MFKHCFLLLLSTCCLALPPEPKPKSVTLNVGGIEFTTSPATLARYPDSLLAQNFRSGRESYFYDRDGDMFRHVLNYLRSGKLLLPTSFDQLDLLREEAHYFNLYSMHDDIVELQEQRRKEEQSNAPEDREEPTGRQDSEDATADQRDASDTADDAATAYECVIVCADEDGKVERWFSAPVDLRFESTGCLLGDCEPMRGYSHILDYRDYTARPGNTVPDHFNIAAIVARLLRAGFDLVSSSSGMDEWHREFYFVFVRSVKKN